MSDPSFSHSSDKDGGGEVCQTEGGVPEAEDRPHPAAKGEWGDTEEAEGRGCPDGAKRSKCQGKGRREGQVCFCGPSTNMY